MRFFFTAALLMSGLTLSGQSQALAMFGGLGSTSYSRSATVSAFQDGPTTCLGGRFLTRTGRCSRIELNFTRQHSEVTKNLFLPYSNKNYLLSTTHASYKRIAVDIGVAFRVFNKEDRWNVRLFCALGLSGSFAIDMDVVAPSGASAGFKSNGDDKVGTYFRSGARYSRRLWKGTQAFLEFDHSIVLTEDYGWEQQRGLRKRQTPGCKSRSRWAPEPVPWR